MIFNEHLELEGKHAILGASQYHWLNYKPSQLRKKIRRKYAPTIGTVLHKMSAEEFLSQGRRIRRRDKNDVIEYLVENDIPRFAIDINQYFDNLYHYINDSVYYGMDPEVPVSYSKYCFGTADAMSFENSLLRVHDLKTGTGPVSMKQLYIYTAIFCLEYEIDPYEIDMELRIYQKDNFLSDIPDYKDIRAIMRKITLFNKKIEHMEASS